MSITTGDTLESLAARLATADGARGAINDDGGKYWQRNGNLRRASRALLSYHGVQLVVDYFASGYDADAYVEQIKAVEVQGVDIMPLLSGETVEELCGRVEEGWVVL